MAMSDKNLMGRLPLSIWVLGFVSMLMDMSSELIHSLLPAYLVTVLGASALSLGLIEGVAEATALIVKVFSGYLSDYLGKRKTLALMGYGLAALSKPLFAMSSSIAWVFGARFIDRIGKGIRGAPRDALVADFTLPQVRGAAYGLRQALDTVGAFMGPLLAIGLMLAWSNNFRAAFWIAAIPACLAVILLLFGIQESPHRRNAEPGNPIHWRDIERLSGAYWWVVMIGAAFTLARFSEAFLILHAQQLGLPVAWAPLVLVVMNVVFAASAYPLGSLADRVSHIKLLTLGLVTLILADLILACAASWGTVLLGVAVWGLHMGMTQGLLATMVAATAPADLRGTAFGFFNLLSGLAMLIASLLAGLLWDQLGPSFTFHAGIVFCVLALTAIVLKSLLFRELH